MTVTLLGFRRSFVQDGQKTKRSSPGHGPASPVIPTAIIKWRNLSPLTTREELACVCFRSVSTVDRWTRGVGEPTVSDVWLMERHKPGLVDMLFATAATKREVGRGKSARS